MTFSTKKIVSESLETAEKYFKEGKKLHKEEKYDAALELLQKAKDLYLQLGQSKDLKLADTLDYIGASYYFKGNHKLAIHHQEEAFAIRMEALGGEHEETLKSAINLASMYATINRYEEALSHFDKVIKLQPTLLNTHSFLSSYFHINKGICYTRMGDYGRAIPYFQKNLQIAEQLETPGDVINTTYNWLGICYARTAEAKKAIDAYQKAVDYNIAHGKEYSERTAGPYVHLGEIHNTLGQHEEAINYFKKALHIQTTLYGEKSDGAAFSYKGLGRSYLYLMNLDEANKYLQKALAIRLEGIGAQGFFLADTYVPLASLNIQKKDYIQALDYSQKGLCAFTAACSQDDIYDNPPLKKMQNPLGIDLLNYKAEAFHALFLAEKQPKYLEAALENAQLTIDLLEQLRNSYRSDDSKLALPKEGHDSYITGINISYTAWKETGKKDLLEQAFGFAEKAKAALLFGAMQEGMAKEASLIPADILQREKQLRTQLSQIEQSLQQKEADKAKAGKEAEIRTLQVEYLKYQQAYLQLIDQLEADYPDYYQLKYQNQTASISQIQELLQLGELLIQYSLYEENLFVFAIDKHHVSFKKTSRPKDLKQKIEAFEKTLFLSDKAGHIHLGIQLYYSLLAPIEEALKGKDKLIIIPDGVLQRLSFDALIVQSATSVKRFSELPYLIKNFDVQYHYSATLLCFAQQKKASKTHASKENFLGLAPIKFGQTESASNGYILKSGKDGKKDRKLILKSGGNEHEALVDLEETETEVKTVYELFEEQEKEAVALFYEMASKENLLEHIEDYKYVLLSTHGFSNAQHSALSGLNLYKSSEVDNNDSEAHKLYISDIMNLQLSADLVVLSSCESGVGKLQKGEGMMG
ncbi:MAG: tetratricopeptide repeat protein, partial [Chitinophagales bacterium]